MSCESGEDGHGIGKYYDGQVSLQAHVMHEVGPEDGSVGDTSDTGTENSEDRGPRTAMGRRPRLRRQRRRTTLARVASARTRSTSWAVAAI